MNVVTLDFPSLIERISQKFNYEAAMLGFRNVDLDPNRQMNYLAEFGATITPGTRSRNLQKPHGKPRLTA